MFRLAVPQLGALAILVLALAVGRAGQTVVDVTGLPLAEMPVELGPWACTDESMPEDKNTTEVAYLNRTYEHEDGTMVSASFQVTSSRRGALRNWSVAQMGNGWNVEKPTIGGPWQVAGLPFDLKLSLQWLHRPGARRLTATWFASPRTQALTYDRAQLLGWRDKLLGHCVWGEMYVTSIQGRDEATVRQAIEDLSVRLAPHFHAVLAGTPLAAAGAEPAGAEA